MSAATAGDCGTLAFTGVGYSVIGMIALAGAAVIVGVFAFTLRRRRTSVWAVTVAILVVCVGSMIGLATPAPALAATSACLDSTVAAPVVQTSVIASLGPGVAALPIYGRVTNYASQDAIITAVIVTIADVRTAPTVVSGVCSSRDFTITSPRMPVGLTLAPGADAQFSGAMIGFKNLNINQDACKGATVQLRYDIVGP